MARVIVSAGHTQAEPGALQGDLKESDLTRKISSKVAQKLRNKGIITLSVPPELDLLKRIDWINKTGYREETEDICIEIHINDGGKSGLEGWYKERGKNKSEELTKIIIEEACRVTGLKSQGIKSEYDHSLKTLAFLHNTNPTSTLIECLYIDNPADQEFLKDDAKLDLLADGIVSGILKFFGIESPQAQGVGSVKGQISTQPSPTAFPRAASTYTPPPPIQTQPFNPYMTSPSPSYPGAGASMAAPSMGQSREERKKMVQDKYHQILGRKVNDQDLSYFLNLGLTEEQMMKRLVESQEHADILEESQEFKKIKPDYDKLKIESEELKSRLKDKEDIIAQQNTLITQKNRTIHSLQGDSESMGHAQEAPQPQNLETFPETRGVGYQEVVPQKESFFDKILRKLNDIFD